MIKNSFTILRRALGLMVVSLVIGTGGTGIMLAAPVVHAAGLIVNEISSPGPAMGMSDNGMVAGFYVAKCVTLSSQPKRTICYNAPWIYDGKRVSKLSGKFPSNANAKAVAVNNAGDLVGADLAGAWYISNGVVDYVDGSGTGTSGSRLYSVNNNGVAVGMSYVNNVYRAITFSFNGVPSAVLASGYAAADINDDGFITGWFKNANNVEQGFIADAGGAITFVPGLDPALNCRAARISQFSNGNLWVTGNCAGNRPFRYRLGDVAAEELSFPGSSNLSAVSINSRGETAGTAVKPGAYAPDGYTALLWTAHPSSPVDLNAGQAFAPASAWNVHATDISETGTVLAGYNDTTGNFYTFLLTPAP